ncbi:MAG TPA: glycosyltransferase family 9 protein [Kineosporiaceae bacterium]|nr:glycosyltransferase family 9 protein [Kineosporiaceae bacterium]
MSVERAEDGPGRGLRVGPLAPRLDGVRRIAVLRGGGLGDGLYAVPALRSLRDAYPRARLTLLGSPGHAQLFMGRPGPVDEVVALPIAEGVHQPPGSRPDPVALERFFARMRAVGFDLAVQLHGGGRSSNPFLLRLGAGLTVGARSADAVALDRWIPYRYYQNEVMRSLEVAGLAGAPVTSLQPEITVTDADRAAARGALDRLPRPLLTVHPGAGDPRRHWPAERFAAVAAQAVRDGAGVAVIGADVERPLVATVVAAARGLLPPGLRAAVADLGGRLDLSGLVGTLAASRLVLANDSGPGHLALAVGTPTVRLFWIGNVISAAPLGRHDHRVLISWQTSCPVCGAGYTDPALPRCPHDASALDGIGVPEVLAEVTDLLGTVPGSGQEGGGTAGVGAELLGEA